jgi:hypothetical protein
MEQWITIQGIVCGKLSRFVGRGVRALVASLGWDPWWRRREGEGPVITTPMSLVVRLFLKRMLDESGVRDIGDGGKYRAKGMRNVQFSDSLL